jgi:hypothetical protein
MFPGAVPHPDLFLACYNRTPVQNPSLIKNTYYGLQT